MMMADVLVVTLMFWSLIAKLAGRDTYATGCLLIAVAIMAFAIVLEQARKND